MWCNDPDKAFDIGCCNLTCEDWCQDISNCPLQRKDQKMFIIVKKELSQKELESSDIILILNDNHKSFSVVKHRHLSGYNSLYHISTLKNILLSLPDE